MLPLRFLGQRGLWIILAGLIISMPIKNVSAEGECVVSSPQDILNCALNQHPNIINAEAEKFRDSKLVEIAKQRPNPELNSRLLGGQSADDTKMNTETSLLHTFELGGKRKYRIGLAQVLGEQSGIQIKRSKEEVALQTVLALYRLRQIRSELARIDETVGTFSKILATFKSRPKLAPEQDISQSSFGLSREEYKLKKIALIQEQTDLLSWLKVATGIPDQVILKHLPAGKNKWPNYIPTELEKSSNAILELARSEKNIAKTNVNIAKSKAWPDLKIGPTFDTESLDSGATRLLGGVNFSIPIPLLNRNKGGKAYAQADQIRAEKNLEIALKKTASERELQFKRYKDARNALRSTQEVSVLTSQHQKIETFFEQGMVSSTLVIETHRQLYEITKTRNEQELTGIDALWRLYILDGKVDEAKL